LSIFQGRKKLNSIQNLERETGLGPATSTLATVLGAKIIAVFADIYNQKKPNLAMLDTLWPQSIIELFFFSSIVFLSGHDPVTAHCNI
jgi:hypothetical protein